MGTSSSSPYIDSGGQQTTPQDIVNELKSGLQRFLDGQSAHPHATEARRHQLAGGQHPQVAVLACSDSRVPVEVIFDAGFGDLFVIRNAGNTNTFGSAGSIEYAVADLGVCVLLVMSHQGCGAVKAAYQMQLGAKYVAWGIVYAVPLILVAKSIGTAINDRYAPTPPMG